MNRNEMKLFLVIVALLLLIALIIDPIAVISVFIAYCLVDYWVEGK